MANFLLIHGAWHGGAAWAGVLQQLRAAGHRAQAPTLPGMNPEDRRVGIEFADYVAAVVAAVREQPGPVILVGHSSAGMLLQAAAPKVAEQLAGLVFNNAFVVAAGQSQLDNLPPDIVAALAALAQSSPDNTVPATPLSSFVRETLMQGDPVAVQDALLQTLVPQPFALFSTPVDTQPFEATSVPRRVLFCTRDASADYMHMATRLGEYRVATAAGSHEMLFADPGGYTAALLKLVA